jgi:hypothetical protein
MGKQKSQTPQHTKSPKQGEHSDDKIDPSKVTLLTHPMITLRVSAILFARLLKGTLNFISKHVALIISILGIIGAFLYAPGPHEEVRTIGYILIKFIIV